MAKVLVHIGAIQAVAAPEYAIKEVEMIVLEVGVVSIVLILHGRIIVAHLVAVHIVQIQVLLL